MSRGWAGPAWGEPSKASESAVPLRARAGSPDACYRADGGESADFVVMAASVAGVGHRLAGRRCEDAYAWALPVPGRLALVIADGVSTAGRGGEGADLAVSAVCDHLVSNGGGDGWGEMECEAGLRAASAELVRVGGASAIEFSTTLVVALLSSTEEGAEVALARVGDSSAFVFQEGKWSELFPDPDEQDMRGLVVEVLPLGSRPGAGSIETSSVTLLADSALVLLTDGVADPLRDGPGTVAPALAETLQSMFSGDLAPLDLAAAADFSRRGCLDDRTVLVAWARAPAGAGEK
jgi:serine/threonine protein phosphatase PrpC